MDPLNFIITIILLHSVLFFFDAFLKSCSHYPYLMFLQNTGLHIEAFRVRWFTTSFNRLIQKWGLWRPKLLHCWFTVGSWFSLGLIPFAFYLIIKATYDTWYKHTDPSGKTTSPTLEPMVPGINLPFSDIGYYSLTLITCSVVHEIGHALAAVREDVHLSGFGVLILFFLPAAYVHLNTDQLEALSPRRRLRILCAGVWHNIVLALVALLLLLLLPAVIYPFYEVGSGVYVRHIQKNASISGPSGLKVGDRVTKINDCVISDAQDWYHCILEAVKKPSPGYCVTTDFIRTHDESIPARQLPGGSIDCCGPNNSENICFEHLEKEGMSHELPEYFCLRCRTLVESTIYTCMFAGNCNDGSLCLKPSLDNVTRLLSVERSNGQLVLFLGYPAEIYRSVQISDYVPAYSFLSCLVPEIIETFCKYIVIFSTGLGVVNIIPCFYFDGQHIIKAVSDLLLTKRIHQKNVRHDIATFITILGSCFLIFNFMSVIVANVKF